MAIFEREGISLNQRLFHCIAMRAREGAHDETAVRVYDVLYSA